MDTEKEVTVVEDNDAETQEVEVVKSQPKFDAKPILQILFCAAVGLGLGIWFSLDEDNDYEVAISWLGLPGDLFLRALRAIVLPLVFVNIILAIIDMIDAGKASSIGWQTMGLYLFTTLIATFEGLIVIILFKSGFSRREEDPESASSLEIWLQCPSTGNITFLAVDANGGLFCDVESDTFLIDNSNSYLQVADDNRVADDISLSQTLQDGIFRKLVPQNIVDEFVQGNFVGVLMFAIIFGVASQSLERNPRRMITLLKEINTVFLTMMSWIILFTPVAVGSLVAGNLGGQPNLADQFADIGLLMAGTLTGMTCHALLCYPILFYTLVKENPFKYYQYLLPAQTLAFACSSSAATLPVSLDCVASTGQVPTTIRNFVVSMGATINMDGSAIYMPIAIVFLAVSDGLEDRLDAASYFMIALLCTIGTAGAAPVPSAGLVIIITAFNTVFDTTGTPESFGLILAVDWLNDRFRTVLNVTGDMTMARIVTAVSGQKVENDMVISQHTELA